VAAFGNWIMWDQGLKHADRLSWRVAKALAADVGLKPSLVADRCRSGAEILAGAAKREGSVDTIPSCSSRERPPSDSSMGPDGGHEVASRFWLDRGLTAYVLSFDLMSSYEH
jgi:hypothetical protein